MESVVFHKKVNIADMYGVAIREGSVLKHTKSNDIGVVTRITRAGDTGDFLEQVGDIHIQLSPGIIRVTNKYSEWVHCPREEQTYIQRYVAWMNTPLDKDYQELFHPELTIHEYIAVEGILALLPEDIIDVDHGPWADNVGGAIEVLANYLESIHNPREVSGEL